MLPMFFLKHAAILAAHDFVTSLVFIHHRWSGDLCWPVSCMGLTLGGALSVRISLSICLPQVAHQMQSFPYPRNWWHVQQRNYWKAGRPRCPCPLALALINCPLCEHNRSVSATRPFYVQASLHSHRSILHGIPKVICRTAS